MTPAAEEATFIALWQAGWETAAIAAHLGLKATTAQSRARRLQLRGLIQPRPRGGAYPSQTALARQGERGVSADTPRVSSGTPTVQYVPPPSDALSSVLQEILQELRHLTGALADRVSPDTPRVPPDTPGVSPRTPLPADRGKSVRWNLHLSERLREAIKARAQARGLQDSQLVEELLWHALTDHP